jgi:TonB-linked SusC/RagA family outer membrane protein
LRPVARLWPARALSPTVLALLLLAVALVMPASTAHAQSEGTIEGTVIDAEYGDPLPGVQVVLPDLSLGAVSDVDGAYRIEGVPAGTHAVEARFVSYSTEREKVTVEAGDTVTLDFSMRASTLDLDEVVVTGTGGPIEKRKLGNSIGTISTSDLQEVPIQSFSDLLQGREPGLLAMPSSGLTGEGTRIRIRGSASLSQSNEPLMFIDGVRVNNGGGFGGGFVSAGGGGSPSRLDDIDPEAIERVEILKGAAAATLFGTEASNGVIQVFTKRGTPGAPQFAFSTRLTAIQYPSSAYPDQVGFARTPEQATNAGNIFGQNLQQYDIVSQNVPNGLVGTGFAQEYAGSVRGGGETALGGVTYFVSGRYLGEDGPFEGNDALMPANTSTLANDFVRRAMGTANVEIVPNDDLRLRVTAGFFDTDFETLQTNNNVFGTISLAQFSKPEFATDQNRTGTTAFATVAESVQQTTTQEARHFNGSANVNYRPQGWLTLDTVFGVDYANTASEENRPFGWNINDISTFEAQGSKRFATVNELELTLDAKANAINTISERFESTFTTGVQGFISQRTLESGQGLEFPGPGFAVTEAARNQAIIEQFSEVVNAGIYAQEQIGFDDYLFATIGARYDANSAFGQEFNGVFYPKVSMSFIPSDAPFWGGPVGPLSSVLFRAAVGQAGLQPGAFDALTTFGALNAGAGAGVVPGNLGNPDLKPEISTEWEVGTELGFFNDRASLEATYWDRVVNDALVARNFAPSGGFRNAQLVNVGELKGRGVELGIDARVFSRRNTSVDVFANGSYLWEQVTSLGDAPPIKVGGSYPRYRNYLVEGYAPGTHFGVQLQDVGEGFLPVDIVDGDGNPDSIEDLIAYYQGLSAEDLQGGGPFFVGGLPSSTAQVLIATNPNSPTGESSDFFLGKPTPDWQGAFGFDVKYKAFSMRTLFEYKAGNYYVNNLTGAFRQSNPVIGRNTPLAAEVERNFVTGGVDDSGNPLNSGEVRVEALQTWVNELLALAPFQGLNTVENADFIRWRELNLTYRVPPRLVERFGGRSLTLTVAGRNLALWTRYSGVDPELNAIGRAGGNQLSNNFLTGVEAFGFPIPRRYSFQVRFGF